MGQKWEVEIKPKNRLFEVNLKELWKYRNLIYMYFKRDIVTVYKQTILGPAWFVIQPIFTTLMYIIVFGGIAGIPTDGLPPALFYLAGILCWNYFSVCLIGTSGTFSDNQGVFGKVYFPRLVVPISLIASNLLRFFVQLILFIAIYVYYLTKGVDISPNRYLLFTPILILMLAFLSLGIGIIISSLTIKYRDLKFFTGFVIQLWMYATPIIYPISSVPEKYRFFVTVNPVSPIIEAFKYATLGIGQFNAEHLLYSASFTVLILFTGIILFNRTQRSFMDTI